MLNVTTRLAVSIRNKPPWEFNWDDTTPQKQRHDLTVDDLPNAEDGQAFFDRAVLYTVQLITASLASLKKFLAPPNTTLPQKSVVIPQKVLFRDEKYTDENIKILRQYIKDCNANSQETHRYFKCATFKKHIMYM